MELYECSGPYLDQLLGEKVIAFLRNIPILDKCGHFGFIEITDLVY
jgi:hypothetical protein